MAGNISGLSRNGRTNSADLPMKREERQSKRDKLREQLKSWLGELGRYASDANAFMNTVTGNDYLKRQNKLFREATEKHFPRASKAAEKAADLLAQGAAYDTTAGFGGMAPQVGIFLGPKAKNFPHDAANKAIELLRSGMTPEEVRIRTGIFFDSAGIPRFEVPSPEDFTLTATGERWSKGRAQDPRWTPEEAYKSVHAPVTFENYPEMRMWPTRIAEDGGVAGTFVPPPEPGTPAMATALAPKEFGPTMSYPHGVSLKTVTAHELGGHGIDYIEGSSFGGMPRYIPKEVRDAYPGIDPYPLYRRAGGENMANLTGGRSGLDAESINAISPYHQPDSSFPGMQEEYPRSQQWSQQMNPSGRYGDPQTFKKAFDPETMATPGDRPDLQPATPLPGKARMAPRKPISKLAFGMADDGAAASAVQGKKSPIGQLGDFPTTEPQHIIDATRQNGGNTVHLMTGETPSEGYMMGKYRNTDPRNMQAIEAQPGDVERFVKKNRKALSRPENYIGTWFNPDDGKTYFDVSKHYGPDKLRVATKAGERTGQISGFNMGTFEEIPVGNWRDYMQGDEFANRMSEMNQKGIEHLSQHPNKDWWNMHGTDLEATYGAENLPYVAGGTSATAGNMNPRQNLQAMSEYMRRKIAGEDIIQPDWRVGDAGGPPMTFKPGSKMPMEAAKRGNIERGMAGQPLSGPKLESERRAMLGDPDAVVLDRWWARLGENPSKGVYTDAQEGVLDPSNYPVMEEAVRQQARKEGYTPNSYSSNVWTGTRETAKSGELYGVKTDPGAIYGDSKSYGDHFTDLINEKASFLGISPQDMMQRLRSGDANLLSVLPLIPGGMALMAAMGYSSPEEEPVL